ncbi:hypothetical protein [Ancylobacter sp. SL191]|uniref:hypothetical protein n=1 Tax=Ancylobacter sp. SL191 TaxID=2995166 RepID=UPI00226F070D|nr:hypothetical protein [Ancylobacter sp. SL191]WAC26352.1 hypothetical protein OU996_15200 [Ancylobacter sp. SL191]
MMIGSGNAITQVALNGARGTPASAYARTPAPAGYRWDFVTYNGERVTFRGEPVVALVET